MSPKAKEINAKMNIWDLIKLRNFSIAKETIDKMKKPIKWEKISANVVMDKA